MAPWHTATGPSNLPGRIALPAKPGSFGPEVDLEPRGTSRHPRPKIPSDHSAFSQTEMFAMVLRTSSVSYDSSRCAQIVVLRTLISVTKIHGNPLSSISFNFHKGISCIARKRIHETNQTQLLIDIATSGQALKRAKGSYQNYLALSAYANQESTSAHGVLSKGVLFQFQVPVLDTLK